MDSASRLTNSHSTDANEPSLVGNGAKERSSDETAIPSDWSYRSESIGFKFSHIQDVVLLRIVLRRKAHLAQYGQKRKIFDHVFVEYHKDAASTPLEGNKHPTSNVLRCRFISLMKLRIQYFHAIRRMSGGRKEYQVNKRSSEVKISEIEKEKSRLIDQVLDERKAAGFTDPIMKSFYHAKQDYFMSKDQMLSKAETFSENQDEEVDNLAQQVDGNDMANERATDDEIDVPVDNTSFNDNRQVNPTRLRPRSHNDDSNRNEIRRTRSAGKRVRFLEEHGLPENTFDKGHNGKRQRLTNDDEAKLSTVRFPPESDRNRLSSLSRAMPPTSVSMGAPATTSVHSPPPSPPSLSSPETIGPSSPLVAAPVSHSRPLSSPISSSPNSAHYGQLISRHSAVASPLTKFSSFGQDCGRDGLPNGSKKINLKAFKSSEPVENFPSADRVIPNGGKGSSHSTKEICQDGLDDRIVAENSREGPLNGSLAQVGKGSLYSQHVLLDLIRKQMDVEKEHLSRIKEQYDMARQLIKVMEQRLEIDQRRLEVEEHDLKRKREVERRRLEMEERNHMRMHALEERYVKRRHELERERLELERNELTRLAEERCARQEIDRRQLETMNESRSGILFEKRKETEAARQMITAMHETRIQHRASNTLENLIKIVFSKDI